MTGPGRRTLVPIFFSSGSSPDLLYSTDFGEGGVVLEFTLKCLLRSFTERSRGTFCTNLASSDSQPEKLNPTKLREWGIFQTCVFMRRKICCSSSPPVTSVALPSNIFGLS